MRDASDPSSKLNTNIFSSAGNNLCFIKHDIIETKLNNLMTTRVFYSAKTDVNGIYILNLLQKEPATYMI